MVRSLSNSEIVAKASRGYIKDYYVDSSWGTNSALSKLLRPSESFDVLLNLMKDHTFNTEVNVLVDAIMKEGYHIHKKGKPVERSPEKEAQFANDFRGYRLLKQIFLNLIVYRNCFVENVKKDGQTTELHTLETTEMNINVTPHGEILGYTQLHASGPFNPQGQPVFFSPEEAIHISPSRITTNPWGFVDTQAIYGIVDAKAKLENYIANLFNQNKFRDVWIMQKSSSSEQVKNFVAALKEGALHPTKDIVVEGEIEQKQLRSMTDFQYMLSLLNSYKDAIREFLRVPPIMTGDVGSSNKSSSEFQVRYAFDNTVISWHRVVEDEFTHELFPIMGGDWADYEIKFNPLDKTSEKTSIEMAVQLKGLGFKSEDIVGFLLLKGINLPEGASIKTPEEMAKEQEVLMGPQNAILGQKLQNMNAKSRQPTDKSKMNSNKVETKTTRQEQVTGK